MIAASSCGEILRFFFFQAEDGIRDLTVTGVQTCALPISLQSPSATRPPLPSPSPTPTPINWSGDPMLKRFVWRGIGPASMGGRIDDKIGRASCRERV